jgi:hypothetical protein
MIAVGGGADSESFRRARGTATVRRDSEARLADPHVETIHRQVELNERHCEKTGPVGFEGTEGGRKTIARTLTLQNYSRIVEVDHSKHVPLDELLELAQPMGLLEGSSAAYYTL